MKALSLTPEYAAAVALGMKTVELRTWQTPYRGDLLICASTNIHPKLKRFFVIGHALAVVSLKDIVPFTPELAERAMVDPDFEGKYAWLLENIRPIVPVPVKGKLHLYEVELEPHYLSLTPDELELYWGEQGLADRDLDTLDALLDEWEAED